MARAWINDRWLTDSKVILPDGSTVKTKPSAQAKRSLAAHMSDPMKAQVPERYRTQAYGTGSRWEVYWIANGTRKRRNFKDLHKAESFMAEMEDDIRSGRYINPNDRNRSFGEIAELWKKGIHGTIKQSTEGRYLRELRIWVMPRWDNVPIGTITPPMIQQWITELLDGTAPRNGQRATSKSLSPKTIKSIVTVVFKAILEQAVKNGWLIRNPVREVKIPKPTVQTPRIYLTPAEVKTIADETSSESDMLAIYVLAYTGIRIGELLALRCQDVDLDARTIAVIRTQSVDLMGCVIETLPKGNRTRVVPLPANLTGPLARLSIGHDGDDYLFRAPRGGRWSVNNWRNRVWYPTLQAAGMSEVEGLVIHSLRHSYASLAIKSGADVKTLQSVMGHASAVETLDTYADLWPSRTIEIADIIDGTIIM